MRIRNVAFSDPSLYKLFVRMWLQEHLLESTTRIFQTPYNYYSSSGNTTYIFECVQHSAVRDQHSGGVFHGPLVRYFGTEVLARQNYIG